MPNKIGLIFCALFIPAILSGCLNLVSGTSSNDNPGTFSYYSEVGFAKYDAFCADSDTDCDNSVPAFLGNTLQTNGWQLHNGNTDGDLGGAIFVNTSESTVIGDTSNLVYISSHGGSNANQSMICLYYCDGSTTGGQYSVYTGDIGNPWAGPNWFVVDGCDVVAPNQGWESKFGSSLHGILGFSQDVNQAGDSPSSLGNGGLETFANDVNSYQPAIKAWEDGVAAIDDTPQIGMLVPSPNVADSIERSGGTHFGPNGDKNPLFYSANGLGTITTQQTSGETVSGNELALTGESINESQWMSTYGNPSGTTSSPTSNEHKFSAPGAIVTHYLASGGIVAIMGASGTAGAVSQAQALSYAESWVANNGGLPSDAILSYAGEITNPNPAVIASGYTQYPVIVPTSDYPAYNTTRAWVFIWRHSSGMLSGDKIEVMVDDAGTWTFNNNIFQKFWGYPWNSSPNVRLYSRVWRTLGGTVKQVQLEQLSTTLLSDRTSTAVATGYCAPEIGSRSTNAIPCEQYYSSTTGTRTYVSLEDGTILASH
ncbi:MAG: hypothetical protein WA629_06740 [Candidatus Aquilonibacter sp.]